MKTRSKKGFAAMDADTHRKIASKGGKAKSDKRYKFTSETASKAGKIGGSKPRVK